MQNPSWLGLRRADESQSGRQPQLWEHLLHVGLHAYAILDEHHHRVGTEQRRQQRSQQMVVHRLEAHQHHIALRHIGSLGIGPHVVEMEIAIAGVNLQPMLTHIFIVTMEEEVHLLARLGELGAIETAYGTCANHTISHLF